MTISINSPNDPPRPWGGDPEPHSAYRVIHRGICDDLTKWDDAGGTESLDTAIFRRSTAATPGMVKITGDAGTPTDFRYPLSPTLDLTGAYIILEFYQYHSHLADGDASGDISLNLYDHSNSHVTSTKLIWDASEQEEAEGAGPGWKRLIIPCESLTLNTVEDLTALSQLRVVVTASGSEVATFGVGRLDFVKTKAPGSFVIRVDTSADTDVLTIAAYAAAKGVKLTLGVVAAGLGASSPSIAVAKSAAAYGHEIVVYGGRVGSDSWELWTGREKLDYVRRWTQAMKNAGLAWNGVLFVPGGSGISDWDREYLIEPGLLSCICGNNNVSSEAHVTLGGFREVGWTYFISSEGSGATPSEVTTAITRAEADGGLLVLGSHVTGTNVLAALKSSIDDLANSLLTNETFGSNIGLGMSAVGRSQLR